MRIGLYKGLGRNWFFRGGGVPVLAPVSQQVTQEVGSATGVTTRTGVLTRGAKRLVRIGSYKDRGKAWSVGGPAGRGCPCPVPARLSGSPA